MLMTLPSDLREKVEGLGALAEAKFEAMAEEMLQEKLEALEAKEKAREAAGGSLKPCSGEGCRRAGRWRCQGCYFVFYCSRACQEAAWGGHRAECRKVGKEFQPVVVRKGWVPPGHELWEPHHNTKAEGHCVVQIEQILSMGRYEVQVKITWLFLKWGFYFLLLQGVNWKTGDLLVQNCGGSIKGTMAREGQEGVFDRIARDCRERGFRGRAGFYMAVVEANEEEVLKVRVNPVRMLPVEAWVCLE